MISDWVISQSNNSVTSPNITSHDENRLQSIYTDIQSAYLRNMIYIYVVPHIHSVFLVNIFNNLYVNHTESHVWS